MKKETFVCDVCGVQRKDANHWFLAHLEDKQGFHIQQEYFLHRSVIIAPWISDMASMIEVKHLCGQACVHKFVDEFMSKPASEQS